MVTKTKWTLQATLSGIVLVFWCFLMRSLRAMEGDRRIFQVLVARVLLEHFVVIHFAYSYADVIIKELCLFF